MTTPGEIGRSKVIESRSVVCTLTADGLAPFVHPMTSADDRAAAHLTVDIWLMGHPERRSAKNIQVVVEEADRA